MTTPAEARSPVTGQQQTAFDRDRVVGPERQDPGVAKTSPGEPAGSAGAGQTVFDQLDGLQRRLAKAEQAQAKLNRQQALARARQQRYQERHREQVRKRNAAYMSERRARQRTQGMSPADQQQPVFDREAHLEQQVAKAQQEAQEAQAKLARQRELKNARQRRWRQAHPEETRQRKREERDRARRRQSSS